MRALFVLCLLLPSGGAGACETLKPGPSATVSHVIDGETLRLHDGSVVRLAGVVAPRAEDVGAVREKWPSAVAARAELEAIALGRNVELAFGGAQSDRYGRQVAHVYVQRTEAEGERQWLQGHLLRQGLARVLPSSQNRACARELLALEAEARSRGVGLWAEAAYRVRDAAEPDALLQMRGSLQIIEGEVAKVERTRGGERIAFSSRSRLALRVFLPRAGRTKDSGVKARRGGGDETGIATGQRVRVRGYVEERGGAPFVDLAIVGDVEVLGDGERKRRP